MDTCHEQEAQAILWLQHTTEFTTRQIISLWRHFGSLVSACQAGEAELGHLLPETPLLRLLNRRHQQQLFESPMPALMSSVTMLPITSPAYPALLKELHTPPPLLYVRGNMELLAMPQIAMVGSRRATVGGSENARAFARELARCGFVITSGLALGIDAIAHRGAMEAGQTVAVLATGVEQIYPRQHRQLADDIIANGGVLISEMPADTSPLPSYFPQRNRIISGLSFGVLVVEAARKSGSLITARTALEQGREVFAMPGSIHNPQARGCHQLIRDGATLVETVQDIAEHLGAMVALKREEAEPVNDQASTPSPSLSPASQQSLSQEQQQIVELLGFDPVDFDQLVDRSGLAVPQLTSTLLDLELNGLVTQVGSCYQRIK